MNESSTSKLGFNQELIDEYEKIRADALVSSKHDSKPGLSILLFRGMANWIDAHQVSGLLPTPLPTHHCPQQQQESLFTQSVSKEATTIMTNMILSHQRK